MSVLVSKTATEFGSTVGFTSANGFFKAIDFNLSAVSSTLLALSTLRIQALTTDGTPHGNSGVCLCLSLPATIDRSVITVLAKTKGTCTFTAATDKVNFTGHSLLANDPVVFTGGTLPTVASGSFVLGTVYYVKTVVDANSFTLSDTPGGTQKDLTSAGSGTTTLYYAPGSQTLTATQILNATNKTSDATWKWFEWTTVTGIDNTATWSYIISQTGGTTGNFSLRTSNATAVSRVELTSTAQTFSNNDTVIFRGQVIPDANAIIRGDVANNTGDTTNAIAGILTSVGPITASSNNEPLYFPATIAGSYKLTIDGCLIDSSHSGIRIGTALSLTATVAQNDTSATLSAPWTGTTGTYQMTFYNGLTGESAAYYRRWVTLTNGATTCTWTGGMDEACLARGQVAPPEGKEPWIYFENRTYGTTTSGIYNSLASGSGNGYKPSYHLFGEIPDIEDCELLADVSVGASSFTTATDLTAGVRPWAIGTNFAMGKQDTSTNGADRTVYTISGLSWDGVKTTVNFTPNLATYKRLATTTAQPSKIFRYNGYGAKITSQTTNRGNLYLRVCSNLRIQGIEISDINTITNTYTSSGFVTSLDDSANKNNFYFGHCSLYYASTGNPVILAWQVPPEGQLFDNLNATAMDATPSNVLYYNGSGIAKAVDCISNVTVSTIANLCTKMVMRRCVFSNSNLGQLNVSGLNMKFTDNHFWGNTFSNTGYGAPRMYSAFAFLEYSGNYFDRCLGALVFEAGLADTDIAGTNNYFGTEVANTSDFVYGADSYINIIENNPRGTPIISATYPNTNLLDGSRHHLNNYNNTVGKYKTITRQATYDNLTDSAKLTVTQNLHTETVDNVYKIDTGAINGVKIGISVNVQISNSAYYAGTKTLPTLHIVHNGVTVGTDAVASANTNLQNLQVIFTAAADNQPIYVHLIQSSDATDANSVVNWDTLTLNSRQYGKVFDSQIITLNQTILSTATLATISTPSDNPFITEPTQATVHAYTGFSYVGGTLTISENHTVKQRYDWVQDYLTQDSNMFVSEFVTTIDGVNYSDSCDDVVDTGIALTGGGTITMSAGKTFTETGTATYDGTIIEGGVTKPLLTAPNIVSGSRMRFYNNTTATEVANFALGTAGYRARISLGTGYNIGDSITMTATYTDEVGGTAKLPLSATGVMTSTGLSFIDTQTTLSQYATWATALGKVGSDFTEFGTDFINIFVEVDSVSGPEVGEAFVLWFLYILTTEDGIRNWFGGLTVEDDGNVRINAATLDLHFVNIDATTSAIFTGTRIYRSDGTALADVSSDKIQFEWGKVYTGNVASQVWSDTGSYTAGSKGKLLKDASKAKLSI